MTRSSHNPTIPAITNAQASTRRPRTNTKQDPAYAKRWRLDRARGIKRYVPAAPVASHVHDLIAAGAKPDWIATAGHVARSVVLRIAAGQNPANLQRKTADALRSVTLEAALSHAPAGSLVPAVGTHRRINALGVVGHTLRDIDAEIKRQGGAALSGLLLQRQSVTRENAHLIARVYDALWDVPGTSVTASRRARARGGAEPMAWDDDTIDDPDAEPTRSDVPEPHRKKGTKPPRARNPVILESVMELLSARETLEATAARLGVDEDSIATAAARRGTPEQKKLIARARAEMRDIREGLNPQRDVA